MDPALENLGWTEDQWNRICSAVTEEAQKARVAAQLLPVSGPEDPTTVAVPRFALTNVGNPSSPPPRRLNVDSDPSLALTTIAVNVQLRTHEIADPDLKAALVMFRRAANYVARVEDALIFNGRSAPGTPAPLTFGIGAAPSVGTSILADAGIKAGDAAKNAMTNRTEIDIARVGIAVMAAAAAAHDIAAAPAAVRDAVKGAGGTPDAEKAAFAAAAKAIAAVVPVLPAPLRGIPAVYQVTADGGDVPGVLQGVPARLDGRGYTRLRLANPPNFTKGQRIVRGVVEAVDKLERKGQLGPYACILSQTLFEDACDPTGSLVLPRDRILPFLQGPLLRSSTVANGYGAVIALSGNPVEIVVAADICVRFLQATPEPRFVFRVSERVALRVIEDSAIAILRP